MLPVNAEWVRVACESCEQLCRAQQQRARQRARKQQPPQQQQQSSGVDAVCGGSPCLSYLCSLHLLLSTHCVSLSACPSLLPLTLQCSTSHPQLLRALLTATHDWSEAQIVQALRHVLHARNATPQPLEKGEWRTDHTLSDQTAAS